MNNQNYTRSAGNVHPQSKDFESTALQCGVDPDDLRSNGVTDSTGTVQTGTNRNLDKSGSRFINISQLLQRPPTTIWVVYGFITADTIIVILGEPSGGKSLLVIDLTCHIGTGRDWCGHRIKQGLVLYVAGEGQHGLSKRFMAWFERYGETPRNIHIATVPAALTDPADITALIADIAANLPEKPVAIILDTLNRNFGSGDENSTSDMTKAVQGLDRIRAATQAAIIVVHHCGKGDKTNSRGSSVLKGAADAEFLIEKDPDTNIVTMRHGKPPKDFDPPPALAWVITKQGTPWCDEDGQPIDSVVLEPIAVPPQTANRPALGDNQRKALDILKRLLQKYQENLTTGGIEGTPRVAIRDWNRAMHEAGFPKQRCAEVKKSLLDRGLIEIDGGGYAKPV